MNPSGDSDSPAADSLDRGGVVAWIVDHPTAANVLMIVLLVGGLLSLPRIPQEVFPEAILDIVTVSVPYPGAAPEEVENAIVLAVEEAIRGVDGVKEIRSTSSEGVGTVTAELASGTSIDRARNDIESAVNRITSFPEDAEEPVVSTPSNRRQVLSLILYGEVSRHTLDTVSQEARRELLRDGRVAQVQVAGLPPPEISIEVEQAVLREFDLTRADLARAVEAATVELPAGTLETPTGEFLLRIMERRDEGREFGEIVVLARPDGTQVTLDDLARVVDGFRETDQAALFNGMPAVELRVFRTSDRTPVETSKAVREFVERISERWPDTIRLQVWNDASKVLRDRIDLLIENGRTGVLLVLAVLALFLRPRLAFWVTIGLPVSFLGVFLLMPFMGTSINMLSLFAFILVLGIVVDDAIVVGEASFHQIQRGESNRNAALAGAREVRVPVMFAVVTTVVAFVPMLFLPGLTGEFFRVIPLIVIPILLLSLVESFLVLPAHLAHMKSGEERGWLEKLSRPQRAISTRLERFVDERYRPFAHGVVRWRWPALTASVALLLVAVGYVAGGRIAFRFLPDIEATVVTANIELPVGAPRSETRRVAERVTETIQRLGDERFPGGTIESVFTMIGRRSAVQDVPTGLGPETASHLAGVSVWLGPAADRQRSAAEIARAWREELGTIAGVERLSFTYRAGPGAGPDINLELAHEDLGLLRRAAAELAQALSSYDGVSEVDDGSQPGTPQVELRLRPGARALGVTEQELARQVRAAFFGTEALRTQRGPDELRVYVRRPDQERRLLTDLHDLRILTADGGEMPLGEAAFIEFSRSYIEIEREQGRRAVEVTASIDRAVTSAREVTADLQATVLPDLMARHAGLSYELSGQQQDRREALGALGFGMTIAVIVMYGLLAVVFSSYAQPLLILAAIPFGFVGALIGHLLMGFDLSIVSMFGLVALAGVVVNDSLVLIARINHERDEGKVLADAIADGAARRFRPVLLTSLTTFFGLAPMIFETSLQARFLIPMALSLGFGVLFVTVIALAMVPSFYACLEDLRRLAGFGDGSRRGA